MGLMSRNRGGANLARALQNGKHYGNGADSQKQLALKFDAFYLFIRQIKSAQLVLPTISHPMFMLP
jgi:hypothetical protein